MNHKNELNCADCEVQLMDYVDGVLSHDEQLAFEHHLATCEACRAMLADAQRGASLLEVLKADRPEPPADLMHKIIAQTSGLEATLPHLVSQPAVAGNVLQFPQRRQLMHSRLAMTAAMAFFSVALSANLLGVGIHNLRPSSLERDLYRAQAKVIQFYDNLTLVADLRTDMHDAERNNDDKQHSAPQQKGGGSSQRQVPTQPLAKLTLEPIARRNTQQGVQA